MRKDSITAASRPCSFITLLRGSAKSVCLTIRLCMQLVRGYATKDAQLLFWPSPLGEALVGAYRKMGLTSLWQPALRCSTMPSMLRFKTRKWLKLW